MPAPSAQKGADLILLGCSFYPTAAPNAFTSLNSAASFALSKSGGPLGERNRSKASRPALQSPIAATETGEGRRRGLPLAPIVPGRWIVGTWPPILVTGPPEEDLLCY